MDEKVSVAQMKSHFSEYLSKVPYARQNVIITRRNKPIAALVDIVSLEKIQSMNETEGLASIVGKLHGFNEIVNDVEQVYHSRSKEKPRDVSV